MFVLSSKRVLTFIKGHCNFNLRLKWWYFSKCFRLLLNPFSSVWYCLGWLHILCRYRPQFTLLCFDLVFYSLQRQNKNIIFLMWTMSIISILWLNNNDNDVLLHIFDESNDSKKVCLYIIIILSTNMNWSDWLIGFENSLKIGWKYTSSSILSFTDIFCLILLSWNKLHCSDVEDVWVVTNEF